MKAMILAAGFGTRLHPITVKIPKALVELAGEPLIAHVLRRLQCEGFSEVAVNMHHEAGQLAEYLANFSIAHLKIHFSVEQEILGTGGGIKKMVSLLGVEAPILVHNVDVLSDISLANFYSFHIKHKNTATLAVQNRPSKRHLLFDQDSILSGRVSVEKNTPELVRKPEGDQFLLAFNGIQVIDPALFLQYQAEKFSSIDAYLDAAGRGERVMGWLMDRYYWRDLGKPLDLQQAEEDIRQGIICLD